MNNYPYHYNSQFNFDYSSQFYNSTLIEQSTIIQPINEELPPIIPCRPSVEPKQEEQVVRNSVENLKSKKSKIVLKNEKELITKGIHHFKPHYAKLRIERIMDQILKNKKIRPECTMMMRQLVEIFVREVTNLALKKTLNDKRKTLRLNDIIHSIVNDDKYDFCIDFIPSKNDD